MKKLTPLLLLALLASGSAGAADAPAPASKVEAEVAPLNPAITADPPAVDAQPQAIDPGQDEDCADCSVAEKAKPDASIKSRRFLASPGDEEEGYSIVSVAKGLSTHKPMYILPATYSPDYPSQHTEVLFTISAKLRLYGTSLFFGYSQRSFFQVYDSHRSRPFRETDYNPELFYRWTPDPKVWKYWGADFGAEHESNGQDVPQSRSWNRLYVAPFRARGKSLIYIKAWYRLPEEKKKTPDDPKGDDNPDIEDHYGYAELHFQRQIGKRQVIQSMFRFNPETGHGALNINYTIPSNDGSVFYQLYVWQGYGESLLDYNDSVTRVGLGIAFSR